MGALNSWGIYFAGAAALLLLMSPVIASASKDSREGVDLRNVEGVHAVLASLTPGVSVRFQYGVSASDDPIVTQGHQLRSSYGGGVVEMYSAAALSNETLLPRVTYRAYLGGGEVVVVPSG